MTKLSFWLKNSRGATAIEYVLIASGIALAIATVVFSIGSDLASMFQAFATVIESKLV